MNYYCYFTCLPTRGQFYVLIINKQHYEHCGGVRWPAVAALRAAPQFRNALLKLYFFISDHIFSLHISCFSSTTGSLLHLNVHHLQKK